jgi:transcriptional regulator with XRE-family HTH domain
MLKISELLDKSKACASIDTDYRLAKVLGITHSAITNYRMDRTLPDERVIQKLCALTGDDPDILTAQLQSRRARTEEGRLLWLRIAARLQGGMATAASVVMTCVLSLLFTLSTGVTNEAQAGPLSSQNGGALYVM